MFDQNYRFPYIGPNNLSKIDRIPRITDQNYRFHFLKLTNLLKIDEIPRMFDQNFRSHDYNQTIF